MGNGVWIGIERSCMVQGEFDKRVNVRKCYFKLSPYSYGALGGGIKQVLCDAERVLYYIILC